MKTGHALALGTAVLLIDSVSCFAEATNKYDIAVLVQSYVPGCHLRRDATGKPEALVSATGQMLDLAAAAQEHPEPSNNVTGYWFTPTMDFLSGQKPKVASSQEAAGLVQLLHGLWRGPGFVQQKLYSGSRFRRRMGDTSGT